MGWFSKKKTPPYEEIKRQIISGDYIASFNSIKEWTIKDPSDDYLKFLYSVYNCLSEPKGGFSRKNLRTQLERLSENKNVEIKGKSILNLAAIRMEMGEDTNKCLEFAVEGEKLLEQNRIEFLNLKSFYL